MKTIPALLAVAPLALSASIRRAPLLTPSPSATIIDGSYIVKLDPSVVSSVSPALLSSLPIPPSAASSALAVPAFHGFAVSSLSAADLDALLADPRVAYVEPDAVAHHTAGAVTQVDVDYGLGRLSALGPDGYPWDNYTYDSSAGGGTCAYVLDSGIETTHPEFGGRASWLANFVGDGQDVDLNGHGTHVAGIVGAETWGVAKKTRLFAVKVLDAEGSTQWSTVIRGMEFIITDAAERSGDAGDDDECPNGMVVNVSIGGYRSVAVNEATAAMHDAGLFVGVAAGNEGQDVENTSPASEPLACVVGATQLTDEKTSYSNSGALVDVFAAGQHIESTYPGNTTESLSGTSMAAPHVTGLAAYFLTLGVTTPAEACDYIVSVSQKDVLSYVPEGTINAIAVNEFAK